MRPPPHIDLQALRAGERSTLARAITLAEGSRPDQREATRALLSELEPHHRDLEAQSYRLGVTGSPGVGKSTFIEAYGTRLTAEGHRVAVLAVDPSSNRTHGSVLGDKTRMPRLARDRAAFIRPSPAGRTLGGVTRATQSAIVLCECAGFDRVIVETVGVGQSEHAVHSLVDCMALLVLPGAGDDLQGIKRGIVELADLVVVNKADGERRRAAVESAFEYRRAVHLQPPRGDGWSPKVLTASALDEGGLDGFVAELRAYRAALGVEAVATRRARQAVRHFERDWRAAAVDGVLEVPSLERRLAELRDVVASGEISAARATAQIADELSRRLHSTPPAE